MDQLVMQRLNKQGFVFAAIHTVFFLNLAVEFLIGM